MGGTDRTATGRTLEGKGWLRALALVFPLKTGLHGGEEVSPWGGKG